jgi:hypothetical protein
MGSLSIRCIRPGISRVNFEFATTLCAPAWRAFARLYIHVRAKGEDRNTARSRLANGRLPINSRRSRSDNYEDRGFF